MEIFNSFPIYVMEKEIKKFKEKQWIDFNNHITKLEKEAFIFIIEALFQKIKGIDQFNFFIQDNSNSKNEFDVNEVSIDIIEMDNNEENDVEELEQSIHSILSNMNPESLKVIEKISEITRNNRFMKYANLLDISVEDLNKFFSKDEFFISNNEIPECICNYNEAIKFTYKTKENINDIYNEKNIFDKKIMIFYIESIFLNNPDIEIKFNEKGILNKINKKDVFLKKLNKKLIELNFFNDVHKNLNLNTDEICLNLNNKIALYSEYFNIDNEYGLSVQSTLQKEYLNNKIKNDTLLQKNIELKRL